MVTIRATTQVEILRGLSLSYLGALALTSPILPNGTSVHLPKNENFGEFLYSAGKALRKFEAIREKRTVVDETVGSTTSQIPTAVFLSGVHNGGIKSLEKLLLSHGVQELRNAMNRDFHDSAKTLIKIMRDPLIETSSIGPSVRCLLPSGTNWVQIILQGGVLST